MIIGGVDPGAEGAITFLDTETLRVIALCDMPMSGSELRVRELALDLVEALDGRRCGHLYIERQAPFAAKGRRIGAASAFHIGERQMAVKCIAACHGWPYSLVSAARWKNHFGIRADKALALDCAGRLLPEDVGRWTVRRGHCTKAQSIGRAESALIALFGVHSLLAIAGGQAA